MAEVEVGGEEEVGVEAAAVAPPPLPAGCDGTVLAVHPLYRRHHRMLQVSLCSQGLQRRPVTIRKLNNWV